MNSYLLMHLAIIKFALCKIFDKRQCDIIIMTDKPGKIESFIISFPMQFEMLIAVCWILKVNLHKKTPSNIIVVFIGPQSCSICRKHDNFNLKLLIFTFSLF